MDGGRRFGPGQLWIDHVRVQNCFIEESEHTGQCVPKRQEGERQMTKDCHLLSKFNNSRIKVTFDNDVNGILNVSVAADKSLKNRKKTRS